MLKWLRNLFIWHSWNYSECREKRTCTVCDRKEREYYSEDEVLNMAYVSWGQIEAGDPDKHFKTKGKTDVEARL